MNNVVGIYEEITLEEVISRAKLQLGVKTTDDDEWFEILADEAVRELNTLSFYKIMQCDIEVKYGRAVLPRGLTRILTLWFNTPTAVQNADGTQTIVGSRCPGALYVNLPFLKRCGCNEDIGGLNPIQGTMQINAGHLIFHSLPTDEIISATICFSALNLNEFDEPIIYRHYEKAIWNYLCAQYKLRDNDAAMFQLYDRRWVAASQKVRSADFRENYRLTKGQVNEWWSAWLTDQRRWL